MLPDLQEAVERSVFHAVRKVIVDNGYLPDINNYDVENSDISIAKAAQASYYAAMRTIASNKGFAIELFNNSPSEEKGGIKTPRIVIDTQNFLPGQLGMDTTINYTPNDDNTVKANKFISQTSDLHFNVRMLSSTTKQQRVLNGVMISSLPRRGYMKWYTDEELREHKNLFIRYISHSEQHWKDEGIVEKIFTYEIPDLLELDNQFIRLVPKIKSIDNSEHTVEIRKTT